METGGCLQALHSDPYLPRIHVIPPLKEKHISYFFLKLTTPLPIVLL